MLVKTNITPSALGVLETIMRLARRSKPITYRLIANHHGWTAGNHVHCMLQKLQDAGLVSKDGSKSGTIRPTCRFIPANELERRHG